MCGVAQEAAARGRTAGKYLIQNKLCKRPKEHVVQQYQSVARSALQ